VGKGGKGLVLGKEKGLKFGEGDDRVRSEGKGLVLGKWEDFKVGEKKERFSIGKSVINISPRSRFKSLRPFHMNVCKHR
jgi:hypothetical protein